MTTLKHTLYCCLCLLCLPAAINAQTITEKISSYVQGLRGHSTPLPHFPSVSNEGDLTLLQAADADAAMRHDTLTDAVINDALALYYYERDADKCIHYLQQARKQYLLAGIDSRAAQCDQNTAFAFEEHKHNIPMAIRYAQDALNERTAQKDTMEMANMYKYIGMLHGKMHLYGEGRKEIANAIALYTGKQFNYGVAVSYYDLGSMYDEVSMDSVIQYTLLAKDIWQDAKGSPIRIFGWNNKLLHAYTSINKLSEADAIFKENLQLQPDVMASEGHSADGLHFYKYSAALFDKKKDAENFRIYTEKYENYRALMKTQGKNVD